MNARKGAGASRTDRAEEAPQRSAGMLAYGRSIRFTKGAGNPLQLRNFCDAEEGFVWSSGRWSEITFALSNTELRPTEIVDLILDVDAFKVADKLNGQNLFVYLNGLRVGSYFVARRTNCVISVSASVLRPADNVLTFDTPDAHRPCDFGISDERHLAMQLFSMRLARRSEAGGNKRRSRKR